MADIGIDRPTIPYVLCSMVTVQLGHIFFSNREQGLKVCSRERRRHLHLVSACVTSSALKLVPLHLHSLTAFVTPPYATGWPMRLLRTIGYWLTNEITGNWIQTNALSAVFVLAVTECCGRSGKIILIGAEDHLWSEIQLTGPSTALNGTFWDIQKCMKKSTDGLCTFSLPEPFRATVPSTVISTWKASLIWQFCWHPILLAWNFHFKHSHALLSGASRSSASLIVTYGHNE